MIRRSTGADGGQAAKIAPARLGCLSTKEVEWRLPPRTLGPAKTASSNLLFGNRTGRNEATMTLEPGHKIRIPMLVNAAFIWNKYGVRGRSFVPRIVGRYFFPGSELYIATANKALLSVDFQNLDIFATIFNSAGQWDSHVMSACQRVLRSGDVFFDIGANSGIFSIDSHARLDRRLTVYAFEPQPTLARSIRRSIEANAYRNVHCLEIMLGEKDGISSLYVTSHAIHASVVPREEKYRRLELPISRLDTLVERGKCSPPDVIKIDVEGSELAVFRGARGTLARFHPTIIFEADENMDRMGHTADDLFELIASTGTYKFFKIDPDGKVFAAEEPYLYGNFLAAAERHLDRIPTAWFEAT